MAPCYRFTQRPGVLPPLHSPTQTASDTFVAVEGMRRVRFSPRQFAGRRPPSTRTGLGNRTDRWLLQVAWALPAFLESNQRWSAASASAAAGRACKITNQSLSFKEQRSCGAALVPPARDCVAPQSLSP